MADKNKFPWNKQDKDAAAPPKPFEAVYAGPDFFNPPQQMFQTAHAWPGAFGPAVPPAQPPVQDDPDAAYCPSCGNKVEKSQPFCHECGTPLPQSK